MTTLKEALDQLAKGHELDNEQKKLIIDKWQKELGIQPCEDCISRQAVLAMSDYIGEPPTYSNPYTKLEEVVRVKDIIALPPVQPKTGYISIDNVMSVFDDFMCGEVDEDGIDTLLEMLKDKAEIEVTE